MTSETDTNKPVETWNGACQCGNVKFTLKLHGSLYDQDTTSCNCSICQRNGYLMIYPKRADISWLSGKDTLKSYKFASKRVGHRFCPECGTSIGGLSDTPGFFDDIMVLNVRTFEGVDFDKLRLKKADGRAL